MKKLMIILSVVGLMSFAASCKKCYTCTTLGVSVEYCDDAYNQTQIDALQLGCTGAGGTWAAK